MGDNDGRSRVIYPSRLVPYIILLCAEKFLYAFGVFLSYDLLKLIHIVQFLFLTQIGAAICLVFLQKPFAVGKQISKAQWIRLLRHAFFGCILKFLWLFGLTLCGPFRTLLLFEHSDVVIIAGASALFSHSSSPAKFRGAVFFLLAILGLLVLDHDDVKEQNPEHYGPGNVLNHVFDHITNWTGLSDHKGGVVLLFITLCLQVAHHSAAKRLALDVGGGKRQHAISTLLSAAIFAPWALFSFLTKQSYQLTWSSLMLPFAMVTLLVFVFNYYVESACIQRLDAGRTSWLGSLALFGSGLILTCVWHHPFIGQISKMADLRELIAEDHVLSSGVIFSLLLILFAIHVLTRPSRGSTQGTLIGYSSSGLPMYTFSGAAIQKTSQSVLLVAKNGLKQILEDSDSRKIFYFLCVNLFFTFVEIIYGMWTNSLGLISDGFHMLFDCSALVMGLYAAVMSRWPANRKFSYGFDRVEVLSGFINGLFLIVIAFFVFIAALVRLFDPPDIRTEKLLAVSVAGFCVNLIGIMAFHHANHGHGQVCSGHAPSHGAGGHGHSHAHNGHSHGASHAQSASDGTERHVMSGHNTNMQGVFLHILADTLGSVGVIISTLLIEAFGWKIADPICSLFIASLIFLSVIPLVQETAQILLLRTPQELQLQLSVALQKVLEIDGVRSYGADRFWRHSSKVVCGTMALRVDQQVSEQKVVQQITTIFREIGVNNFTIQVTKDSFYQHLSGLGVTDHQHFITHHSDSNSDPRVLKAI